MSSEDVLFWIAVVLGTVAIVAGLSTGVESPAQTPRKREEMNKFIAWQCYH